MKTKTIKISISHGNCISVSDVPREMQYATEYAEGELTLYVPRTMSQWTCPVCGSEEPLGPQVAYFDLTCRNGHRMNMVNRRTF